MSERYTDVTINDHKFRLGRVTASVGNWMVLQMSAGTTIDQDVYNKMEAYFLAETSIYRGRDPVRIWDAGIWLVKELEYDLDTVNAIYFKSLGFNFDDFFEKRKAEKVAAKKLAETRAMIP